MAVICDLGFRRNPHPQRVNGTNWCRRVVCMSGGFRAILPGSNLLQEEAVRHDSSGFLLRATHLCLTRKTVVGRTTERVSEDQERRCQRGQYPSTILFCIQIW